MGQMLAKWGVPPVEDLLTELGNLARAEPAALRALTAIRNGHYRDEAGGKVSLGKVDNPLRQIAVACWLARQSRAEFSVEIGFGHGGTASCLMSARRMAGHEFEHIVFDPWGLSEDIDRLSMSFLESEFPDVFLRRHLISMIGLASLKEERGPWSTDLIFIDGNHRFDGVMTDVHMATLLLKVGGWIILDDAAYPAIQSVVSFMQTNRPDFEVSVAEVPNTAILHRVSPDERSWDHFRPFDVEKRIDWEPDPEDPPELDSDWELLGLA